MMRAARALLLVVVVGAGACHRAAPVPAPATSPLARDLLALAHELGDGDAATEAAAPAAFAALVARADAERAREPETPPWATIVATLFARDAAGDVDPSDGAPGDAFAREVDDPSLRFVLLPSVLAAHRGSCVGLGTLALALAERLGVRARGVVAPGHFYVELRDGERWRPVELLKRGAELPATWYRTRYGTTGRTISSAEVLGVVAYDVGNERRRQGRLPEARRAYERAVRDFPTFAEAHASLGVTLQLLGALDDAAAAYARARALAPNLPGLARNVALLDAERAKRADASVKTGGGTRDR
jgi:tetratricopeptide (TPR) repeat protein